MQGVTALIISSLNGFGLNIVHKFAKQGYNIALSGSQNDENIIRTIQNEYRQSRTISLSADLQNEIDIHNLVEQILNHFQRVDILIINNECKRHYRASIDEFPTEKWKEIIDYNLISTFALIKTLWPQMKRQHFGRIIHIVSEPHEDYLFR
jgi:3-hydroxybutyrate dehydrogenase